MYQYSFIDMSSGVRSRGGGVGPMDPCYALYIAVIIAYLT
jgi:hypothetical protein